MNTSPKPEAQIQAEILLAVGKIPGVRLWRNHVGAVEIRGRFQRFGLPGSSDLLGLIGPEGRFLAIEVKSARGRLSQQQERFLSMIRSHGGVAIVARSVEDALAALRPHIKEPS